jgi:hypothetical protein
MTTNSLFNQEDDSISEGNIVQPPKVTSTKVMYLLVSLLVLAVGYLFYENYQMKRQINELSISMTNMNSDITNMSIELENVGALARNADMYAHSHYSDERLKENIKPLALMDFCMLTMRD